MNRNALSIALALTVAVIGFASVACSPGGETNSSLTTNRNPTPPAETVNVASIEAEVKKLETDWAASANAKDGNAVRRVLADDVVITYPDGTTGTKNDEIQMVESGAITADAWETLDSKVTVLDADAAFMTGRSVVKNGKLKHPKTQKTIDISGEYRFLDVFAKRNGRWQIVASQATGIQKQP
ncbi:MAG TPA: nuclear transport factor 2 family protein [Pyrinomonadaceae bacterium]|nr:nuclear transport factor 2 family protein [Pyrinomonadaceae bacterium]